MEHLKKKRRILFVDDDLRVLESIKRMFFDMENEWDMQFAENAFVALDYMKDGAFDVVISDMRMPDMDGAELLKKVKDKYPHTICFILSGYTDKEMIIKTVGPADQFLSKPCDPDLVKEAIENALEAQNLIGEKKLRAIASQMRFLPTLPELYIRLREVLESRKSSFADIAKVVQGDVPITAKVLQLVNSAFFGLRQRIENLQLALTYLGIETLKAVILTSDVFNKFTEKEIETFNIKEIYRHSVFVGMLSRRIVETVSHDKRLQDIASMAGMLHDVGKLIFIRNRPDDYVRVYERHVSEKRPIFQIEKDIFDATHADIGGYLMSAWGLPKMIVKAISLHHNPSRALDVSFDPLTAVYISNVLAHEQAGDESYEIEEDVEKGYLTKLDLLKRLPEWREVTKLAKEIEEKEREKEEREKRENGSR